MLISRKLKETISDIPKCTGDSIEFTKIQKWEVSKISLLEQKKSVEAAITMHQSQLDNINQLLVMFESEIKTGAIND